MTKQFVYKKGNAEIIISFTDNESLKKELEGLPEIIKILSDKIPNLLFERKPKDGLEDLYRYTEEGNIELFQYPKSKIDAVLLVLFLKHPDLMSLQQINFALGITDAKSYVNNKSYVKYFRKKDGLFGLKPTALDFVSNKVIPILRNKDESEKTGE